MVLYLSTMTTDTPGATKQAAQSGSTWRNAAKWIESNGGYVHPQLRYNELQRQVYFSHQHESLPSPISVVDAGTTLLQIPDACLLSLHSVEQDEDFGKSLFGAVHSLSLSEGESLLLYHDAQDVILALFLAHLFQQRQSKPQCLQRSSSFYNPYLATLPSQQQQQKSLPRQWSSTTLKRRLQGTSLYERIINEKNGIQNEYAVIKKAWLQQQQQQQQQYEQDRTAKQQQQQSCPLFPTLELYDNMMGIVTSRGFEKLGFDAVDVLIPLLDLLNHARGGERNAVVGGGDDDNACNNGDGGHGSNRVANVRYERYNHDVNHGYNNEENEEENDGSKGRKDPPSKRIKTTDNNIITDIITSNSNNGSKRGGGGVRVTAAQSISIITNDDYAPTPLQTTYGAKSNFALLGRYGFCIASNIEPDGSCNDVVEIELQANTPRVKLQRGPKSYTYGPFIKALQLFHDANDDACNDDNDDWGNEHLQEENCRDEDIDSTICDDDREEDKETMTKNEEVDGGLEAFLDDCEEDDNDQDQDDDLDDMMYTYTTFGSNKPFGIKEMMNDLRALDALHSSLKQAKERCEQNTLMCSSNEEICMSAEDDYCTILIKSEIQTISFYMNAAKMIQSKLLNKDDRKNFEIDLGTEDRGHVHDLVNAFMTIRYPEIFH